MTNDINQLYCLGHLAHINERCHSCKVDKHNGLCDDFKPVMVYTVEIDEAVFNDRMSQGHPLLRMIEEGGE